MQNAFCVATAREARRFHSPCPRQGCGIPHGTLVCVCVWCVCVCVVVFLSLLLLYVETSDGFKVFSSLCI
jgi:hypothetical protein